jgi:hypothetical protein
MRRRYVQDPVTLKLIPEEEYHRAATSSTAIITDSLDGFVADATPTPTYIDSKSKLRRYCKENGLTLSADCQGLPMRKAHEPYDTAKAQAAIRETLKRQLYR